MPESERLLYLFQPITTMREEVCIVLNEREPAKAKAAEMLELRFRNAGIASSRPPVDEHLIAVLQARAPRFIVIDYLLGDYTTGLDVVTSLSASPRPQIYFLTDEPSVRVAVEALRLGVEEYVELDHPQSLDLIGTAVEREVIRLRQTHSPPPPPPPQLDDLVATTPPMQLCVQTIRNAVVRRCPAIVLLGEPGVGLTTLARGAALTAPDPTAWSFVDLATFLHGPAELPGIDRDYRGGIRPTHHHTLILDNIEADEGEVLTSLGEGLATATPPRGCLIATTSDPITAAAYARLLSGETITVPPLRERRPDIPALVHRFIREAETLSGKRIQPFESGFIATMVDHTWLGNVRQLRTVVLTTAIDLSLGDKRPVETIWAERYADTVAAETADSPPLPLDPLAVAATLAANGYHERRAAARLGCTLAELRRAVAPPPTTKEPA